MASLILAYFITWNKRNDRENDVLTKKQFNYFELHYKDKNIAWQAFPQKGSRQASAQAKGH
jgi:predicted DNA-binding protein YlxM (UPF0122 family)